MFAGCFCTEARARGAYTNQEFRIGVGCELSLIRRYIIVSSCLLLTG